MIDKQQTYPAIEQVAGWLSRHHAGEVEALEALSGGFWSSAFAYRVGTEAFVLRLSDMAEGFAIDAAAMRFCGPDLPVPEVVALGEALGFNYAISRRHYGRFLETIPAEKGSTVGNALEKLLVAMRAVPTSPHDSVVWHAPGADKNVSWRSWLGAALVDDPEVRVSGWRARLAAVPHIDRLFRASEARIIELLPACLERRDLIHGDLLHQNVLVSEDASRVTAVFSWKCSALGDFLYDVAWCTFWSDWHPGIAAVDLWHRTLSASDLSDTDLQDAPMRHHCYELQIGASHLGWNAWTGNKKELMAVAAVLERTLEAGPLPS